jgi:hypothetical protein
MFPSRQRTRHASLRKLGASAYPPATTSCFLLRPTQVTNTYVTVSESRSPPGCGAYGTPSEDEGWGRRNRRTQDYSCPCLVEGVSQRLLALRVRHWLHRAVRTASPRAPWCHCNTLAATEHRRAGTGAGIPGANLQLPLLESTSIPCHCQQGAHFRRDLRSDSQRLVPSRCPLPSPLHWGSPTLGPNGFAFHSCDDP